MISNIYFSMNISKDLDIYSIVLLFHSLSFFLPSFFGHGLFGTTYFCFQYACIGNVCRNHNTICAHVLFSSSLLLSPMTSVHSSLPIGKLSYITSVIFPIVFGFVFFFFACRTSSTTETRSKESLGRYCWHTMWLRCSKSQTMLRRFLENIIWTENIKYM